MIAAKESIVGSMKEAIERRRMRKDMSMTR